jgi:predicted dehydrogenase
MALDAGAHVICEKPMTGTAAETAELLAYADTAGRALVESRNLVFNDSVQQLRDTIRAGTLGDVVEIDLLLSLDFLAGPFGDTNLSGPAVAVRGGAVHDFLPHLAYLFLDLAGLADADGAAVRGFLRNRSGNPRCGYDFLDALIDTGTTRARLRLCTDTAPDAFRVTVRGSRASVETDLYNPYWRFDGPPNTGKRAPFGHIRNGMSLAHAGVSSLRNKIMQHGTMHGMPRMLDAIYAAAQNGTSMPVTAPQMLATARLVDRVLDLGDAA